MSVKTCTLYQVDAFTKDLFSGNPAGVVTNAGGLSAAQMQAIARECNNSETAFILPAEGRDHDVRVRFFTPVVEVPSCGHATIGAHYARAVEHHLSSCTVIQKIGAGILPVDIEKNGDDYRIVMTQGEIAFSELPDSDLEHAVIRALGLDASDRDRRCPVQIVSTGHSKVMVGIKKRETLHALRPDLQALARLSGRIRCNGYFVFTFDAESQNILTHGRMFAPAIGISEDPVTGNANGPLGAYIVRHRLVPVTDGLFTFRGKQGEAMGRPGIVDVEVAHEHGNPVRVRVGGQAVIVFRTQIHV